MARKATFCFICLLNFSQNVHKSHPILTGIGMEAVIPIKVEILSLQVLMEVKLEEAEWDQAQYEQLNLIEENILKFYVMVNCTKIE